MAAIFSPDCELIKRLKRLEALYGERSDHSSGKC